MRAAQVAMITVVLLSMSAQTKANPLEEFGFGDRGVGIAGSMGASDDALSSAAYNPASSVYASRPALGLGYTFATPDLTFNGTEAASPDSHGMTGALVLPWQMHRDWKASLAGALYVPLNGLTEIRLRPATEPQLVMWESRNHRIVSQGVVGFGYRGVMAFGLGLSVFGNISGQGLDLNVNTLPGRTQANADLQIDVPWRVAPILGLIVQPVPQLRLGLRFMDEIALDANIYAESFVRVPGTSIEGDTIVRARGLDFFVPRSVALAANVDLDDWSLSAQLSWHQWSRVSRVASEVDLRIELGIDIDAINFVAPDPNWHDTWIARFGIEHHILAGQGRSVDLRWGYAYIPTPVPDQTGVTSFADADRHVLAAGAALTLPVDRLLFTLGAAGQAQVLAPRETTKDPELGVGEDFRLTGAVYVASIFIRTTLPE